MLLHHEERVKELNPFCPPLDFQGFQYCARLVMLFGSNERIPEPVNSTASTFSCRSVIVLYQHQSHLHEQVRNDLFPDHQSC